ncbi:hypothetical protein [Streptomyces sp. NPDC047009]
MALTTTLDEIAEVTEPYLTTPEERLTRHLLYLTRSVDAPAKLTP